MTGEIPVRAAVAADAHPVAVVHVRSWQAGYRGVIADDVLDALSVDSRERSWRELLAVPGRVLVAAPDGEVTGFVAHLLPSRDGDAAPDTGEIAALYVEPSHWRRGIARALLRAAGERLARDGARDVTAWVLENNAAGRAFWVDAGFEPDGASSPHDPFGRAVRFRSRLTR